MPETLSRPVYGPHGETEPIDLLDNDLHGPDQCWPVYNWLLEHAPFYKDANGIWHVSSYDGVVSVAMKPDIFTSMDGNRPGLPSDGSFIHIDGPMHRKRKGLIQHYFTPSSVRMMERHVRTCVTELLDDVIEQGACDFVEDVAGKLPVRLICEMTGIPAEHYDRVRRAMDIFGKGGQGPDFVTEEVNDAFFDFGAIHMDMADERAEKPRGDFLSVWLHANMDGVRMNEDEVLFEHTMMLFGGGETTRSAITGGLKLLAEDPAQRAKLLDGTSDFGNAAEEIIRYTCPFVSMSRTLTQDADILGQSFSEGEEVVMLYPPANRDPSKFDRPHEFDIDRQFKHRVLAFGIGPHVCIGAHLARLETRIVLEEMCKRMPDWQLDGEPTWMASNFLRGMTDFPLTWTPGPKVLS